MKPSNTLSGKPLPEKMVKKIIRMWKEGLLGKRAIGKKVGVGTNTVRKYIREAGLE